MGNYLNVIQLLTGLGYIEPNKFMNIRYDGNKQRYFSDKRLEELVNLLKSKWGIEGVYT